MDKDETVRLVDAGVNYGKSYVYRFFCHVISVGTAVFDTHTEKSYVINQQDYITHKLRYSSYPDLRIMKIPVWQSTEQQVFDSLPAYPTTQVLPNPFDSSKVKIVFSDNLGGVKEKAIPIFGQDLNWF